VPFEASSAKEGDAARELRVADANQHQEVRSERAMALSLLPSGREFIDIVEDDLRGQ
jgi:hypothetical protein